MHHRVQSDGLGGSRDIVRIMLLRLVQLLSLSHLIAFSCEAVVEEAILVDDASLHQYRKLIFYLAKLADLHLLPLVISLDGIKLLIGQIELLFCH